MLFSKLSSVAEGVMPRFQDTVLRWTSLRGIWALRLGDWRRFRFGLQRQFTRFLGCAAHRLEG